MNFHDDDVPWLPCASELANCQETNSEDFPSASDSNDPNPPSQCTLGLAWLTVLLIVVLPGSSPFQWLFDVSFSQVLAVVQDFWSVSGEF